MEKDNRRFYIKIVKGEHIRVYEKPIYVQSKKKQSLTKAMANSIKIALFK